MRSTYTAAARPKGKDTTKLNVNGEQQALSTWISDQRAMKVWNEFKLFRIV